jgi:hypothetical protein
VYASGQPIVAAILRAAPIAIVREQAAARTET